MFVTTMYLLYMYEYAYITRLLENKRQSLGLAKTARNRGLFCIRFGIYQYEYTFKNYLYTHQNTS